ncbi:MAG: hypothetical protein ACI9K2_006999 [Myxococcota bacterium]|jgi:hypothetical protein
MPYDPALATRIRPLIEAAAGVVEKKMFGGIGSTIGGNMAVGAHSDGRMMIRCSKEAFPTLLEEPGADGLRRGTKYMTGWVLIDADAVADDATGAGRVAERSPSGKVPRVGATDVGR